MKNSLINALNAIKNAVYKLIDIIFKKIEDKIPDDLGAKFYWPMEADPRLLLPITDDSTLLTII